MDGRGGIASRKRTERIKIVPNAIPPGCHSIAPEMLPLVDLEPEQIERIAQAVPGGASNIQDIYPLTPLQEGILFHHMMSQKRDPYVVLTLLEFTSRVHLNAFLDALQRVIGRHDILRSAIFWEQLPRPVQVVHRQTVLPVEESELDPGRNPIEQMKEWLRPELQSFPLQQAPLMRVQVASDGLSARLYALLKIHHLVCDGQSLGVIIAEVTAHLDGGARDLPQPMQYRKHVEQALAHASSNEAEAFFRGKLRDVDESTAPFGLLDVHVEGDGLETARQVLEPALCARVYTQARLQRVSPATLFHAAWGLVVSHTSGRNDVVFGTVVLGRLQMAGGTQQRVGLFLNTLPLRLQLQDITASELLLRTQRDLFELLKYEQASLALVQRCSDVNGSAPLFTTLLNYRHAARNGQTGWSNTRYGFREVEGRFWTNYPITVSVDDLGAGFAVTAQTDHRIDPQRIVEYVSTALQSLVEALEREQRTPALSLAILPKSERRQVLELFNAAEIVYSQRNLIHELFEEQVERTPDAVAVICEGRSLTYAALNGRANQLARYLRERGVGPDQLVGIYLERGLEMVVGLIGVLKAGGAYVPMDPAYPAERLAYMLSDSAPQVLLTQERLREPLPDMGCEVIALDEQWSEITRQPVGNLDTRARDLRPDHLAYVIYTSGSTGKPKGVMVEHRNVTRLLAATERWFHFNGEDVWTLFHSIAFDFSVWELWGALAYGGRVVIVPYQTARSPQDFYQLVCSEGVTVLNQTPSAFAQLIKAQARSSGPHALRAVIFGGEALDPRMLRAWVERNGVHRPCLVNMYGITETTVHVTYHALSKIDIESENRRVIGRAIPDLQTYLLDGSRQPVAIGVVGELYVGGAGVARGYLNRAELTAERFIKDPFSRDPQTRMYKTGDLGRWRPDGTLEYLGRNDHQVKIRGFRIELGEIEAQLLRHPQVKEAVVLAREDEPGEKRLVAYVVPDCTVAAEMAFDARTALSVETLRAHLKAKLPDYMLPSAFVMLENLPLTANGKLDRRALPAPERGAYGGRGYEAPQGEIEEILAGIWQSLLKIDRVGRRDNFFELGGHSLLIVQMLERLRRVGLSGEARWVFESPTLADLASALGSATIEHLVVPPNLIPTGCEAITPQMLPLVELDVEHIERVVQAVPGGAANIQDIYPLAPLQEGILFHHLLDQRGGDAYARTMLLALPSREKLSVFIRALQEVVDRHDILRTAVLWEQLPRPVQVVYRRATLVVDEIALDPERDPIGQIEERMRPERQRLDLRQAPLVRLQVATDSRSCQWYVLFQTHHLVCDNASIEILLSEVTAHFQGRAQGLPEPVAYRNHVAEALAHAGTRDAEKFFRGKLGDVEEPTAPFGLLDVHGDGSRSEESHQGLEAELANKIRLQARRLSVSAATLFHAAWALVVAHTSGRDDVVYGTVLLGRLQGHAGAQRILGMFINTLPLRVPLREVTAKELVDRTQRELVELLGHEQASLAVAQRCSGIVGSVPLFSSLLNYRHSVPDPEMQWSDSLGVRLLAGQGGTNYPIMLSVDDLGEGFAVTAETDRRIDPQRMVQYMCTAMQSLVEALEQAPRTSALSLRILPESERRQVLELFNATETAYPQKKLIHELFEEQVERTPDAVAVIYEQVSLKYSELNAKANQLARYLRERGVGPDQLVGICVERSLEMVVGLLGILKAGGAYVPLDPTYPTERLAYMLADSAPKILLTQAHLREQLSYTDSAVIALDAQWSEIAQQPVGNLDATTLGLRPDHLAYVIYTSGSTGKPKGVMIEHANVVNFLKSLQQKLQVTASDRLLAVTTISFDIAGLEIYVPLISGAAVVMGSRAAASDTLALSAMMGRFDITMMQATPVTWQMLLNSDWDGCSRLKALCGGEALSTTLSQRLVGKVGALWNLYGPTETTIWSCSRRLIQVSDGELLVESIGAPIANTQIYILDSHRQPVPIGVAGEIYIGGVGVGRGYLNRPKLTAERFIKDPFSSDPQARLYKTGDLGRWRPDGAIEYLGRNDYQVKIRGFRIELGEIEAQLLHHPGVKEAVVLAREDEPGEKRLVAYVVGRGASDAEPALSVETLRAHLKPILPDYMSPSAFVMLESLPLTSNGKLDRRALPAPERGAYGCRGYGAPQGEIEEVLAGIWQSLLKVDRVGRQDNFFELGGHSLLIVQMLERLRRVGLSAEVRRVFESPTLADLASALGSGTIEHFVVPQNLIPPGCEAITPQMLSLVELEAEYIERIVQAVPGGAANIQDIYPLAPLQEGILFHHLLDQRGADAYARTMLLVLSSQEKLVAFIRALQEVIDRHDILRTAVLWEEVPQPVQVVYRRATLVVDEIALDPEHDSLGQLEERMRSQRQRLDLRQAPLVRLQVAADSRSCQWYVLLQTHHLVCDNASIEILFSEVTAHFQGHANELPEPVAYRNHVAQVLAHVRTHDAESFFRGKLGDVDEPTAPFGLLDVQGDGSRTEERRQGLKAELARKIRLQARRLSVSAATLFHAAWALVVARTTGRDDVVYGTVLLGRLQGHAGAQRILGMFINTLPLRLSLQEVTAKGLVERTQRELVELLGYEQASLAVAQRCSGVVGSVPLFSSLLNYRHDVSDPGTQWSDSLGVRLLAGQGTTNYPITVSVDDLGEGFAVTAETDHRIDPQRTVQYMCTALQSLVEALEQVPQTPALSLSILPESERRQVLELFNATEIAYPQKTLIHELFEEQVERTPDTVAVIYEQVSLRYAELNAKANQLARYLRERGVGPDQLVGICVERSLEMVVGLLGILKAGGAYVPLDPTYPAERLAYMLADSAPKLLLTQARLREHLPPSDAEVILLDEQWNEIALQPCEALDATTLGLRPDHLAYVIYTSGSTGQPKGVMIEHHNVTRLFAATEKWFGFNERDVWTLFHSFAFDFSVWELWGALAYGGRVVIVPYQTARSPQDFYQLVCSEGVTVLNQTPSAFAQLISAQEHALEQQHSLRVVIFGGEALELQTLRSWVKRNGATQPQLVNMYGITETTVHVTYRPLTEQEIESERSSVVGRPIEDLKAYLLDAHRQLVPIGAAGEIYIGGAGVARGYLNRPKLTAERFIKDPFSSDPQARLYKTGDLGRWRPDGAIEYLGRNDHQVKIRGFRVEPGEIEAQLLQHPQVKEAIVLAREDEPGNKRLVAYIVGHDPAVLSVETLRANLKAQLPDYMVPSAFVMLESFPLTGNGKLDRRALPAPDLGAYGSRGYKAPSTQIERAVAEIWAQVLRLDRVGVNDNFFELGGHSLLGMKLITRIAAALDIRPPLVTIFQYPTVGEMARLIEQLLLTDLGPRELTHGDSAAGVI